MLFYVIILFDEKKLEIKKHTHQLFQFYKEYLSTVFLIIVFLIIFLKYWMVSNSPLNDVSEVWWGLFSLYIMKFGVLDYIIKIPFSIIAYHGPIMGYVLIPSLYIFGQNTFALRLPGMIIAFLTVVLTYFFTKDFYNKKIAIVTISGFMILPVFIAFHQEHTLMPFFLILSFYIFNRFYKTRKIWYFYLFFLVCGLGITSRLSFIFYFVSLIITSNIVFKNIQNIITYKQLGVAFVFLLLGIYPLIIFNIGNDSFLEKDYPGVTVRRTNLIMIKHLLKNFPETYDGENVFKIGNNLKTGLTKSFQRSFATDDKYYLPQSASPFFPIFVISLILLLCIAVHGWVKQGFSFIRKDVFLLSNLFIIASMISTVTVSSFSVEEFMMIFPICLIIVGRVFSEIFKKFARFQKSLFYLTIVFLICLLLINIYNFFTFFHLTDDIKPDSSCFSKINEIADYILERNHSVIPTTDQSIIIGLNWHFYQKGVNDEMLYIFFNEPYKYVDGAIYTLVGSECSEPSNRDESIASFLEIVDQNNKTAVLEESFYLDSGKLAYSIYRVI